MYGSSILFTYAVWDLDVSIDIFIYRLQVVTE